MKARFPLGFRCAAFVGLIGERRTSNIRFDHGSGREVISEPMPAEKVSLFPAIAHHEPWTGERDAPVRFPSAGMGAMVFRFAVLDSFDGSAWLAEGEPRRGAP